MWIECFGSMWYKDNNDSDKGLRVKLSSHIAVGGLDLMLGKACEEGGVSNIGINLPVFMTLLASKDRENFKKEN